MSKFSKSLLAASAVAAMAIPAVANATVTFAGNFIGVTIANDGSLSSLKHDPAGGGSYGVNDYITPGTPHEGFSTNSTQGGFRQNGNAASDSYAGGPSSALAGPAALGYDFAATWTGSDSLLTINNSFFYNTNDERIRVITTLTALADLTNLAFARSVDPDPDVNTSGSFVTNNQRGNLIFGTADFVGSAGPVTGLTLALINNSGNAFTHNSMIDTSTCCSNVNPNTVLGGSVNNSVGDHSLNMAWLLGTLSTGNSVTVEYYYAVGDRIGTVGGAVPEPSTWAMMLLGFGLVGAGMRRRQKTTVRYAF